VQSSADDSGLHVAEAIDARSNGTLVCEISVDRALRTIGQEGGRAETSHREILPLFFGCARPINDE
jgi:hypothetical protein